MRILVTCDRYPSPRHEGLILRIFHYVRHLRTRHEFDLFCIVRPDQTRDSEMEGLFGKVICVTFPGHKPQEGINRIRLAFDPEELYLHSDQIKQSISRMVANGKYDLVWDAGCNLLPNLTEVRSTLPLLADQVDDAFLGLRRQLEIAHGLRRKLWLRKQLFLQKIFAKRYLANAEAVLFVSPLDEQSFKKVCPEANTITIANGVDETYFRPSLATPQGFNGRPELVFEGVMCFPPNVDAAEHFVHSILPLLKKRISNIHFSLVGRDPSPEVLALRTNDVEVTGFVDDVRPWIENAQVFVCPMRSGAGIKNKILQAWAMGKAVVSTPEGAFGLPAENGKNILLCSSPENFANAVEHLLCAPQSAVTLGHEARKTIEESYSWASKAQELESLLTSIVAKHTKKLSARPTFDRTDAD